MSDYFGNNIGGVGLGIDYFWNNNLGVVTDYFLSAQSYPKSNFQFKGDNWRTTHYVTLAHMNVNISPYLLCTEKHLFYPYCGLGVAWIRTDGDINDKLPKANFGATPSINIGFEYAFIPINPLFFFFSDPGGRLSLKVEYKQLFYGVADDRFKGGIFNLTFGYGFNGFRN